MIKKTLFFAPGFLLAATSLVFAEPVVVSCEFPTLNSLFRTIELSKKQSTYSADRETEELFRSRAKGEVTYVLSDQDIQAIERDCREALKKKLRARDEDAELMDSIPLKIVARKKYFGLFTSKKTRNIEGCTHLSKFNSSVLNQIQSIEKAVRGSQNFRNTTHLVWVEALHQADQVSEYWKYDQLFKVFDERIGEYKGQANPAQFRASGRANLALEQSKTDDESRQKREAVKQLIEFQEARQKRNLKIRDNALAELKTIKWYHRLKPSHARRFAELKSFVSDSEHAIKAASELLRQYQVYQGKLQITDSQVARSRIGLIKRWDASKASLGDQ